MPGPRWGPLIFPERGSGLKSALGSGHVTQDEGEEN